MQDYNRILASLNRKTTVTFSNVRDPVSHIVSLYSHGNPTTFGFLNVLPTYNIKNFDQFYALFMDGKLKEYESLFGTPFYFKKLFTKDGQSIFDHLLHLERIEDDLKAFCKHYGLVFEDEDFQVERNVFERYGTKLANKAERVTKNLPSESQKKEIISRFYGFYDVISTVSFSSP